ncbi:MAG: 3-hydroxyacyl-CoA dehydrogenase family protein [Candidatus Hodarchaeota archaeon]
MNIDNIKRILIVGAGNMGHSIALVFAQAGYDIDLLDVNEDILNNALKLIESNLNILSEFNRVNKKEIPGILKRIHPTTNLTTAAENADFVTEAVSELPELKKKVFFKLDRHCSEDVVLASNTSTLDIFRIVKKIPRINKVIAHHYFSPPHIIPIVEIAVGRKTSKETVDFSLKLMEKIKKKPILMEKSAPSYIVNKIQTSIIGAMYELIARDLATPEQIDLAIKYTLGIRLPIVGIVQAQDFTGLDLLHDVLKNRHIEVQFINEKIEKGHLGAKSGVGFYDYGGRTEQEILKKRDRLYLQMLEHLEKINAFEPI